MLPMLGHLDSGPFTVGWTLKDFQRLNDSKYYCEDTLVRTYTLCLTWALRKLDVTDVLVDGSFGVYGYGSAPITKDINIVLAPTFLDKAYGKHWAYIVLNKTKKAIHVFTSSNTIFSRAKDYKNHISLLCTKTGWVEAKEVKEKGSVSQRPTWLHSQPDDDGRYQAKNDGLWQSECFKVGVKGLQCGPIMCGMFHMKINQMLSGRGDSLLAQSFDTDSGDSRLRTLHQMSFLLRSMREHLIVVESEELTLSWALFGLLWTRFKERVQKDVFNVEEKPALPRCNIRQHLNCFWHKLGEREYDIPWSCSACSEAVDEIYILQKGGLVYKRSVGTRILRDALARELSQLCPDLGDRLPGSNDEKRKKRNDDFFSGSDDAILLAMEAKEKAAQAEAKANANAGLAHAAFLAAKAKAAETAQVKAAATEALRAKEAVCREKLLNTEEALCANFLAEVRAKKEADREEAAKEEAEGLLKAAKDLRAKDK
jgi:hypothetical protein